MAVKLNFADERAEAVLKRSKAREEAVKLIYQIDIQKEKAEDVLDMHFGLNNVSENDRKFIQSMVKGVFENIEAVDGIISDNLRDWTIDRISKIVLAALRTAVYEMEFCSDVPTGVAISEAVNIVKTFADEESAGFANGVLGSISRRESK